MLEIVRYNYRLRPGSQALDFLRSEWSQSRWLWNECVHQYRSGKKPTIARLGKLLTAARAQNSWLRAGSQNSQQQTLQAYMRALNDSFTVPGRGRPRPKKRRTATPSVEYTRNGFSIRHGRLILPKGTSVPIVWHRELPSDPKSVRVYQDSLGCWYASFVVERDVQPAGEATGKIGIDWGIKTPAVTTDPDLDLHYAGHRKRCAAELAKHQRRMARRARRRGRKLHGPQSKGYHAAKQAAAKVQRKAQRQHAHDARQWARSIAGHGMIAVEDFKPKFVSKSRLARKASDIAIGTLKRMVVEYGQRGGRKVVMVAPAYTTMTCSECYARTKRLPLNERAFLCPECGYTADRDRNAARVILAVAETGHTSVEALSRLKTSLKTQAA
jgi:putative transposase